MFWNPFLLQKICCLFAFCSHFIYLFVRCIMFQNCHWIKNCHRRRNYFIAHVDYVWLIWYLNCLFCKSFMKCHWLCLRIWIFPNVLVTMYFNHLILTLFYRFYVIVFQASGTECTATNSETTGSTRWKTWFIVILCKYRWKFIMNNRRKFCVNFKLAAFKQGQCHICMWR